MSRVTFEMMQRKANIINNELGINVKVCHRNGYYAIDAVVNKNGGTVNIDAGLSAKEANAILRGMMAIVCNECKMRD